MKSIFFFFLFSFPIYSQTKGIVKDEAGKPIPFVSIIIENETNGVSSEEDGSFSISVDAAKNLVFSAVGYETKIVKASEVKNIQLKKKIFDLGEVVIPAKKQRTIEIDDYGRGGIRYHSFQSTAKYFAYTDEVKNYPFLKEIKVFTDSDIENAKINIRLLKVNPDGSPGEDILETNHIVTVKRGGRNTVVAMEKFNIEIPSNGIFVVVKTLLIDENKFYREGEAYKDISGKKKRMKTVEYEPNFGFLPSEENTCWHYYGKWTQLPAYKMKDHEKFKNFLLRKYHDHFLEIAMSITLTN